MRISDIKYKAAEVLKIDRDKIIKVFIGIGIISLLCSYIGNLFPGTLGSIISLGVSIATIPLSQGYVRTSLKAVNNRYDEIDIQKDGLTGFYRFKELFSTYFIHGFFLMVIVFVIVLISFIMLRGMLSNSTINELSYLINHVDVRHINEFQLSMRAAKEITDVFAISLLFLGILAIIVIIYLSNFALTFFILEKYHITGVDAMKESMKLMKGYKRTYILLCLSFIGWLILVAIFENFVAMLLPVPLLPSLLGMIVGVIVYNAKFNISIAVLYEEIDLAKKRVYEENGESL